MQDLTPEHAAELIVAASLRLGRRRGLAWSDRGGRGHAATMRGQVPMLSAGAFLPVFRDLPPTVGQAAGQAVGLSFDDGPSPATTLPPIETLRRHGATAGHDVFMHGWRHIAYADATPAQLHENMSRA